MDEVEKQILEEDPDFESQYKILEEEKKAVKKRRRWITLIGVIALFVVLIFLYSYSNIYAYIPYGEGLTPEDTTNCENVNLFEDGNPVPSINIAIGKKCVPMYNIDYFNNRRAYFNIDVYGDHTLVLNKMNQMKDGVCLLNCDEDSDGWPDYNIDLNGDGKADLNIMKDTKKSKYFCDLNCDLNHDMIPDTNIDINGDGVTDVNITSDSDYTKPIYNLDYKGNRVATFNIRNAGKIINEVVDASDGKICKMNCDIDGDGWPDYNLNIDNKMISELFEKGKQSNNDYYGTKYSDWKCFSSSNNPQCMGKKIFNNKYINIDVDGDGKPDVNISNNKGKTITNQINKVVNGVTLNIDSNEDGFPDYNIDIDNDGIADLNIVDDNNKCIKNCDTNFDGRADYNLEKSSQGELNTTYKNINIDVNYDGICDLNCDVNYDLVPDTNIDTNNDGLPNINIDVNNDGTPDLNVDTDNDGFPNNNLSAYDNGVCTFNCDSGKTNKISSGNKCSKNCDTDNDGWPDKDIDIDNDGKCDLNCSKGDKNLDENKNYVLDSKENKDVDILNITGDGSNEDFYTMNPVEIHASDIEPGWNGKYVIYIKNNSFYGVSYNIFWSNVSNNFTEGALTYFITRNNQPFINVSNLPYKNNTIGSNLIIKGKSSLKYVLDLTFVNKNYNQLEDGGKSFKGKLDVKVLSD